MLKTVEMIVDFRKKFSPPLTIMNSPGVIQIPGHHNFSGPEVGQSHWVHCEGPAEAVLPSPAEEVQPATGTADTVLLCHHWISPLHVNNCLVQLSYQIWPQKTTGVDRNAEQIIGSTLPTLQELYSSRVSKRSGKIQHTPSLNYYCLVDATELWAPEQPDTGTVSSLRQSISWTLGNNGKHTTLLYIFITHTYLHFKFVHIYLYIHNCIYYILCLCFLYMPVLYIF